MTLNRRSIALGLVAASVSRPTLAARPVARAQASGLAVAQAYSDDRQGVSLLVRQNGRTLHEGYSSGGAVTHGWELASGTKSFSGVLAAAMVQDGMLSLDELCAETLSEWRGDPAKATVTIHDLLTLTGGVGAGRIGRPPSYAEAVAAPLASTPRSRFAYGPQPFQVFGEIVRRKLIAADQPDDVLAFLKARILTPMGVTPRSWRGVPGQPTLPSGAQITARDWAAFGEAVLAGGRAGAGRRRRPGR